MSYTTTASHPINCLLYAVRVGPVRPTTHKYNVHHTTCPASTNVESLGVAHGRQRISSHFLTSGTQSGQGLKQYWPTWPTALATPASDRRRLACFPSVGAWERLAGVGAQERPAQARAAPSGYAIPDLLGAHRIDVIPVPAVVLLHNVHMRNSLRASN